MPETAQIRIAFVGAGAVAARHAATLLGFEGVTVAAVADPDAGRAAELAARAGAVAYADHERMLAREELDAVYVCLPPYAHGPPEHAAIDAGLPFFVEKPIAIDMETAESVAGRLAGSDLVTAAGYHWRYLDTVERAAEMLADNPARLVLGHWLDKVPPPAWWLRRDRAGGQTIEQKTHVLDLARALVGEVTSLYAVTSRAERPDYPDADVPDVSAATVRFAGGAVGSIFSTCLLSGKHRAGVELFCEGMAIELSELEMAIHAGGERMTNRARGDAKSRSDRAFIDAVRGQPNRIRVPYEEALMTHRLACAISWSAEHGQVVELKEGGVPA